MEQHTTPTESLQYQNLLLDRILTQDITQELSLPDYQPEIKRLLRVNATIQPPTRYIGGGNIEFSGNVDFTVLYLLCQGAEVIKVIIGAILLKKVEWARQIVPDTV